MFFQLTDFGERVSGILLRSFQLKLPKFYIFAESKIADFNVTSFIKENVIRLDISMDVVRLVDVFNGENHFSNVKSGLILRKDIFLDKKMQKVTSWYIVHHEIEIVLVLEGGFQLDQVGTFGLGHKISLQVCIVDLFFLG